MEFDYPVGYKALTVDLERVKKAHEPVSYTHLDVYKRQMYQKYVNSVPLYRQEADWKQLGVKLSRATLANWDIKCGIDYMEPVYEPVSYTHLIPGRLL